ncbi:glycosyl transferase family protein [Sphingomonas azotifigens]|uniref:glycosyl transferase family protein n=1 Tax=Sphingomonas azotifigens TaxID=330920 RepID=UPI000A064221|nr:glycosyl transferase family protein [Sphingomonas azotifigens]
MTLNLLDCVVRELTMFAAVVFMLGGVDDVAVDILYFYHSVTRRGQRPLLNDEGDTRCEHRFAVFVPAWDEASVIGPMLRASLARWSGDAYRIYVGTYPNDPSTIAAVLQVADADARVRLVIGPRAGPTTKADCLNALWAALERDAAAEGATFTAVVLHDAEDVVHPLELAVYAAWIGDHGAVQVPVAPLCQPGSRLVSGHYLDEFAQSHGATLPVRQMLGASLPLAGVGCAIRCDLLRRIAADRGQPFDAASLTEDYELGLTLRALGARSAFVCVPEWAGGAPVAVRAYFPATVDAAVRQKARWMAGIALSGWDRTGWGRRWDVGDHWMRMRDRRVALAMPVLAIAYAALCLWGLALAWHALAGAPLPSLPSWLGGALLINLLLLAWRWGMRTLLVVRRHGWREGVWAAPRMLVANYIGLLAARRALWIYGRLLAGGPLRWDKTAHAFPTESLAAGAA